MVPGLKLFVAPHVTVRPSDDIPHPSMSMSRPPNEILRHPPHMVHHGMLSVISPPIENLLFARDRAMGHHLPPAPATTLSLPQPYASDRGMGMNRSSSSLSGAMTIAPT